MSYEEEDTCLRVDGCSIWTPLVLRSHAPVERFLRELAGAAVLKLEDLARGRVAEVHGASVWAERYRI